MVFYQHIYVKIDLVNFELNEINKYVLWKNLR